LLLLGARATANVRTAIVIPMTLAIAAPPAFVVPIARIVAPAGVKHVTPPTGFPAAELLLPGSSGRW